MSTDRDVQLRQAVLEELAWDARVDERQLDAAVSDGVVTLVGTVPSYARKLAAEEAAASVAGVHDLIDEIDVKPEATGWPHDDELTTMVEQVLTWDALVPEQHLTISVADGWVTLRGHVEVAVQRHEAERVVSRLEGVRGVHNRITVSRPALEPEEVRQTIGLALARRAAHRADQLDIIVSGSSVTLRGTVQTPLEKRAILGAVRHAPGIDQVTDDLRVDPGS